MVVGAKVCELTDGFLWFVCGLYVGILTSPLMSKLLLPCVLMGHARIQTLRPSVYHSLSPQASTEGLD